MKPGQPRLSGRLRRFRLARERRRQSLDRLPLPGRNPRLMNAMFGGQLRQGQLALDRIQRHLGLELGPVALPCHFTHNVPSLTQAGLAYHPVQNPGATSSYSDQIDAFPIEPPPSTCSVGR